MFYIINWLSTKYVHRKGLLNQMQKRKGSHVNIICCFTSNLLSNLVKNSTVYISS